MAKKSVRLYTVRDDVMLDGADRFNAQYTSDKADFEGFNIVMFPLTFGATFEAQIDAARACLRDMVVLDEQAEETAELGTKMKECCDYFQAMKPVIESVFPNKPAIWNQFGFNDYEKARKSQGKMIQFMEMLFEVSDKYKVELIAGGFTQVKIDKIETLAGELRQEQIDQEVAKKERPVKTQERIKLMNIVWATMQTINKASKAVYQGNYAKLAEYELPSNSQGGTVPFTGTVDPSQVVNIIEMEFTEDTELRIKNTGTYSLLFGLAPDIASHTDTLKVDPGITMTVTANVLGDINNKFLNVFNPAEVQGSYEVLVMI
ncbi:MAG: hypothetical protein HY959_04225 [Ignavibacteriae bacterium]|nr:hypothetical protein [Ignavibacteriota bacterium]